MTMPKPKKLKLKRIEDITHNPLNPKIAELIRINFEQRERKGMQKNEGLGITYDLFHEIIQKTLFKRTPPEIGKLIEQYSKSPAGVKKIILHNYIEYQRKKRHVTSTVIKKMLLIILTGQQNKCHKLIENLRKDKKQELESVERIAQAMTLIVVNIQSMISNLEMI